MAVPNYSVQYKNQMFLKMQQKQLVSDNIEIKKKAKFNWFVASLF